MHANIQTNIKSHILYRQKVILTVPLEGEREEGEWEAGLQLTGVLREGSRDTFLLVISRVHPAE